MPTPTKRTTAVEEDILSRMSKGEPLAQICRDEGMPTPTTWGVWCRADEALKFAHALARDEGFDAIAADCLLIADDSSHDTKIVGSDDHSREAADTEWIGRSKLRVETRLKLLAKWDPRRYGDKLELTGDPERPQQVNATLTLTPAEAYKRFIRGSLEA